MTKYSKKLEKGKFLQYFKIYVYDDWVLSGRMQLYLSGK